MFGSEILDVAIGLVFVYLSASLVCSGIMELIAKLLKLRSKHLKEELTKLLKSKDLVNALYQSHLVKEISRGFASGKAKNGNPDPDNIPTNHFVTALIDTLLNIEKGSKEFADFEESIKKIEDAQIREILLKALGGLRTQADKWESWLEATGESIAKWFDHSMDKLSLWYKKQSRKIIFVIGILVTLVLNLDSFMIVKNLYQNETLRLSAVAAAEKLDPAAPQTKNISEMRKEMEQLGFPVGWELGTSQNEDPRGYPVGEVAIIYKIIGLLLTLMAISMGATFWFDILRKLLSHRKGMNSSKEEEEKPKK
ncbi:hypothetical protein ACFLRT_02755 [Acidobacteriota bacterium]